MNTQEALALLNKSTQELCEMDDMDVEDDVRDAARDKVIHFARELRLEHIFQ